MHENIKEGTVVLLTQRYASHKAGTLGVIVKSNHDELVNGEPYLHSLLILITECGNIYDLQDAQGRFQLPDILKPVGFCDYFSVDHHLGLIDELCWCLNEEGRNYLMQDKNQISELSMELTDSEGIKKECVIGFDAIGSFYCKDLGHIKKNEFGTVIEGVLTQDVDKGGQQETLSGEEWEYISLDLEGFVSSVIFGGQSKVDYIFNSNINTIQTDTAPDETTGFLLL